MVYHVVQIPVFQAQLFQLVPERFNLFACQLVIDTGTPALSCPVSRVQLVRVCNLGRSPVSSCTFTVRNSRSRMPPSRLTTSNGFCASTNVATALRPRAWQYTIYR